MTDGNPPAFTIIDEQAVDRQGLVAQWIAAFESRW
jgi:hypothetical protein